MAVVREEEWQQPLVVEGQDTGMLSTVIVPVRTGEIVVITDAMAEELELKEWQRSVHHEDEKWSEYAYTYVAGALNAQGWKQKSADETE